MVSLDSSDNSKFSSKVQRNDPGKTGRNRNIELWARFSFRFLCNLPVIANFDSDNHEKRFVVFVFSEIFEDLWLCNCIPDICLSGIEDLTFDLLNLVSMVCTASFTPDNRKWK